VLPHLVWEAVRQADHTEIAASAGAGAIVPVAEEVTSVKLLVTTALMRIQCLSFEQNALFEFSSGAGGGMGLC
jgi:hypothetical protein